MRSYLIFSLVFRFTHSFVPPPSHPALRRHFVWRAASSYSIDNDETLTEFKFGNQLVTLIGTAHLSKASNDQVTSVIETTQPDVVMVELDETRLERIGIDSVDDIGLPVVTADDIEVPLQEDDKLPKPWYMPIQNLLLDGFTKVARGLLTGMYDDMGDTMGEVGGGEFLAAINTAKRTPSCEKIVLGDRDSLVTLRRAAELAVRSGDPLGVMARLSEANSAEIEELRKQVFENAPEDKLEDEAYITTATIEALKADKSVRTRIFERLEREVPEFTRSFLTERDYIMATAIQREITNGAKHIVAVVGLAHVPGIAANLEQLQSTWENYENV